MGERDAQERFARAVDDETADSGDQEFGAELAVVRDLRRAGSVPVTDERTRHDVAVRLTGKIAGLTETEDPGTAEPAPARRQRRRLRPALAAVFCLLAGLGGLAVSLSASALPGEALYPVKRTTESAVLAMTLDEQEKAQQWLVYAADRVDELATLAAHDSDSAELGAAYAAGLADFDNAVRAASATLTSMAAGTNGKQLKTLRTWSTRQARELAALPPAAARPQASSVALLERVERRAAALHERFDCYRITSGVTDELGAVPATGPCVPPDRQPSERQAPPPVFTPPSTTTPTPSATPVRSPETVRSTTPTTPERSTGHEPGRVPSATTTRAPTRFETGPPVSAPPPVDRSRVPSDAGDAPSSADDATRDLLGDPLDTP